MGQASYEINSLNSSKINGGVEVLEVEVGVGDITASGHFGDAELEVFSRDLCSISEVSFFCDKILYLLATVDKLWDVGIGKNNCGRAQRDFA